MHILGMAGRMRRIYDPTQYEFLKPIEPINVFISISAFVLGAAQFLFLANIIWSLAKKRRPPTIRGTPIRWNGRRPPRRRTATGPALFRKSIAARMSTASPEVAEDYLPQSRLLEGHVVVAD